LEETVAGADVCPFTIEVAEADLDDLRGRLERTRWTAEQPPGAPARDGIPAGQEYGFPLARLRPLVGYWLDGYDWRRLEARLNAYPQFVTEIDGQRIHFLHVRSAEPAAMPLVLTHGWPGSVVEYLNLIGPLTDPRGPGAGPGPAFDVVIPSLPGFGFSGPARDPGWGTQRTARAWAELMARLGYQRYGAVGNDAGSMISPEIGRLDPGHTAGVHVTQLYSFPSGAPGEMDGLTADEQAALGVLSWFWERKGAFNVLHGQQPQTLAHAISDSPAGLLAWNGQLFGDLLDPDFILDNVALYWLTGTSGSSIRFYYEDAAAPKPAGPTTVPIALAAAGDGDFRSIRRFAERDHANIVSWRVLPGVTGHYAAHTNPGTLAADIRSFFSALW
jgi:pimeloyl-ACP methyl ester carboxylesterase